MYSSTDVANNVLSRAFAEKISVSPMKLQKILYFVASEYQKTTKARLFEEPFSTWAYGPVLYSVFNEFRAFSKEKISRYARNAKNQTLIVDESEDVALRDALDRIWNATQSMGAKELSEILVTERKRQLLIRKKMRFSLWEMIPVLLALKAFLLPA